jgi:hypothetical protein
VNDAHAAMAAPTAPPQHFRLVSTADGSAAVEVDETDGPGFALGPVLRKYTAAKLQVRGRARVTTVELRALADALGLLRSLRHDVEQFNSACVSGNLVTAAAWPAHPAWMQAFVALLGTKIEL